jgi:hypothetical protein
MEEKISLPIKTHQNFLRENLSGQAKIAAW